MALSSNNTILRVISYLEVGTVEMNANGEVSGPLVGILKDIEFLTQLFFEMNWVEDQDSKADIFQEELVPKMISGEVDLVGGFYYITLSRLISAVPLVPLSFERFTAYFRQPHITSVRNMYAEPFKKELFFAYFVLSFILFVSIGGTLWTLDKTKRINEILQEAAWWIIAFIGLKSHNFFVRGLTLRTLFIFGALFFSLMYALYSAFITSSLTAHILPIRSITDLITNGFTFQAPPAIQRVILSEVINRLLYPLEAPAYKKPKYSEQKEWSTIKSFQSAIEGSHVHVDNADYFLEFAEILHYPTEQLCKKISTLHFVSGISSTLYVPKNSFYRSVFNEKIAKLTDVGLLHRYNRIFSKARIYNCPKINRGFQENLSLSHVLSAFAILFLAFPIVIIIFVMENYSNREILS